MPPETRPNTERITAGFLHSFSHSESEVDVGGEGSDVPTVVPPRRSYPAKIPCLLWLTRTARGLQLESETLEVAVERAI